MTNLNGRVALVTGAGGGLGRSHALFLARQGARVAVNDVAEDSAARVVKEITEAGFEAVAVVASVTDEASIAQAVRKISDHWGRIDILVNNAGILRDKTFAKMTLDDFRLVLDVHVWGTVICTKALWNMMREQRYGRVVLTTSSSGLFGNFGQSNYAAAKMALVGLMQTLAIEGEKYNIRVNCLAPSAATNMTRGLLSDEQLALLSPDLVSPGLLALVGAEAPTRSILCGGAGHFSTASITLSHGHYAGVGDEAGESVLRHWTKVTDRTGEIVPQYGLMQVERELANATRSLDRGG